MLDRVLTGTGALTLTVILLASCTSAPEPVAIPTSAPPKAVTRLCSVAVNPEPGRYTRLQTSPGSAWFVYVGTVRNRCATEARIVGWELAGPQRPQELTLTGAWTITPVVDNVTPDAWTPTQGRPTKPTLQGGAIPANSQVSFRAAALTPSDLSVPRALPDVVVVVQNKDGRREQLRLSSPCSFTSEH